MKSKTESSLAVIETLIALLVLLGLGGIGGGIPMLLDPSGTLMRLPKGLLNRLPINNFILPGLFLIVVMGLIPFVLAYGMWRRRRWAWLGTLVQGAVLVLWICFQIILWGTPIAIQYIYLIWGIVLLVLGLLPQTRRFFLASES